MRNSRFTRQSPRPRHGSAGRVGGIAVALVAVLVCAWSASFAVAKSSSSSRRASTKVSAKAAATVAEFEKAITKWPGPDTPFTPPAKKKVTVITCSSTGITCVRVANGVQAAAKVLGWSVNVVNGEGNPTVWNSAIRQAITDKSNGIILAAVVPALAAGAIQAAKKAHIPVIYTLGNVLENTNLAMDTNRAEAGRVLADWTAVNSGGKAQVMVLYDREFPELISYSNAYVAELKSVCPGCKVVTTPSFTLGAMATRLPGIVSNALQDNPGIDYVVAPYDSAATFIQQGARAVRRTVKVMGDGGDPPTIANLKNGTEAASMGVPSEWMGWQAVDAVARYLVGKPLPNTPVVQGLIVPSDVSAQAPKGYYTGGFNYEARYEKLWGK